MKKLFLVLGIMSILILVSGCGHGQNGVIKNPKLEVELVQPTLTGGYIKVKGLADLDLSNINNTWVTKNTGISLIKQNSEFVTRFKLDYPNGNPPKNNVSLVIKTNTQKIPQLGLVTRGYDFIASETETIQGDEFTKYVYSYGSLKEGTTHDIIFVAQSGSIGSDLEAITPIYVSLENEAGKILGGSVDIKIDQPPTTTSTTPS